MLAINVGYDCGGAAHHVAISESKVQSANACAHNPRHAHLLKYSLTGTDHQVSSVLNYQQQEERACSKNGIYNNRSNHIFSLIACALLRTLIDIAEEHYTEDDQHVRKGLDYTGRARLEVSGKVPNLIVDAHKTFHCSHPKTEEADRYYAKKNGLPDLACVNFLSRACDAEICHAHSFTGFLALVGLDEKANSLPRALSGGQMQRISIARALVKDPKIILADEPTAALDYDTSIKVLSVIEKIAQERKTTVIMVTHNPEIAKMANRVIKLRNGKIASIRVNLHPLKATDLVW
ncbi:MAG: ATP-binding cassette domain-containing protein [Firmicutes bacterium]|nr:ATP-binding cassette domain-containing protein [Bacillota bacterium]